MVLVRKKDGIVRWCIDCRKLNDCTRKDAYPLPRIDMCLDCLVGASIFSTMDLQSGYWQIVLEEKDREKSAFITKYGLFEYTKMPFGLCTAPSTFQRCMELIFRGMQWKHLLNYLDDIIIFSQDMEDHFKQVNEVLQRPQKCRSKTKTFQVWTLPVRSTLPGSCCWQRRHQTESQDYRIYKKLKDHTKCETSSTVSLVMQILPSIYTQVSLKNLKI